MLGNFWALKGHGVHGVEVHRIPRRRRAAQEDWIVFGRVEGIAPWKVNYQLVNVTHDEGLSRAFAPC